LKEDRTKNGVKRERIPEKKGVSVSAARILFAADIAHPTMITVAA